MSTEHKLVIASSGNINSHDFSAKGSGTADTKSGLVHFELDFDEVPPAADPFGSLLAMLIWDTTVHGKEEEGAVNLSSLSEGPYEFVQHIGGDTVSATAKGQISKSGDHEYLWSSRSDGVVNLDRVTSVENFDAIMIPEGPGRMSEYISIPILSVLRRNVVPIVRHITFHSDRELPGRQLRHMKLTPTIRQNHVSITIETAIFPFEKAKLARRVSGNRKRRLAAGLAGPRESSKSPDAKRADHEPQVPSSRS
jgi:hypothetical protein